MGIIEKPIVKVLMLKGEKGEQGDVNLSQLNNEKNARISADNNLQSQIDGLANGTPLVASSTSGMTDTSKVYVNTTDGNWYYYNGSSWVIGGTYQATGIGENSVSIGNLTNLQRSKLYEEVNQNNVSFDHTTIYQGSESADNKVISSPFIYMIKGSIITFNNSPKVRITRYNDNKEYVSNTGSYTQMNSYTIPEDNYYRISIVDSNDTGFELTDALTLVEFVGYRERIRNYNEMINYTIGTIDDNGKVEVSAGNRIISDLFEFAKGSIIKLYDDYSRFKICIDKYDKDGNYLNSIQWNRNTFVADKDYKLRVRIAYSNDRTIRNEDVNIIKKVLLIEKCTQYTPVENNNLVLCSAHRGSYNIGIPENTIIAYKFAKEQKFNSIETDVRMTSDHIPVICHDDTINRTARNSDGTTITGDVYVANSTFDELNVYDYGIYKGQQYAGTPLLTFEEVVKFAKFYNIKINIDCKVTANSDIDIIYNILRKYGMQFSSRWTVATFTTMRYLLSKNGKLEVAYGAWEPTVANVTSIKSVMNDYPNAHILADFYTGNMTTEIYEALQENDIELSCFCEWSGHILQAINYGAVALTINNYLPYELLKRTYDNQ